VRAIGHEIALSRLKAEFVSNVSHEFKTPLSLIRMFGETLESGVVKDEAKRLEFCRIIRSESERLSHLINNVLDFSRVDAGIKQYNFRQTDIVGLIRNALETYKIQIHDLGFTIDTQLPSQPLFGQVDPDAISQALLNLLDNAVKYSEERKYIRVNVGVMESWILISVEDQGVGIPADDRNNIFEKFYRTRSQKALETPGSGLGLTLVKHIAEAHGGQIGVESAIDQGSKFTLKLPMKVL
jgi:signal transduction histidine kinase